EEGEGDKKRIVLKLHPKLAPYKVAVFPLVANKPELVKKAREVYKELKVNGSQLTVAWDDRGNIGKRYFAQDEIGTPWCVTADYQTLEDSTVTVRDRDTTKQERIKTADLPSHFLQKLS
ncbi:MAG: His/Gly/Thr/Pro-type tRNA ligase C-terminal domain-containing protein, partial [Patescibacteria group bacterium]